MILADKIIKLRKKNGWSQEELADKINVSRQTVSKWESSTAVPSLNKILQLGKLFGVTSDYLLKDEIDEEEIIDDSCDPQVKRVSLEEANNYIEHRKKSSRKIAIANFFVHSFSDYVIDFKRCGGTSRFPHIRYFGGSYRTFGVVRIRFMRGSDLYSVRFQKCSLCVS